MHFRPAVLFLLTLSAPLLAANTTRRYAPEGEETMRAATVRAATSNAVRNLYDDVGSQQSTADVSVRSYLRRMLMEGDFRKTLQSAEQVGDPRWVSSTCQVQLEIK